MLIATLDRLKLTAIRDQLDTLLDEAARSKMTLRRRWLSLYRARLPGATSDGLSMSSKLAQFRSCANWTASTSRRSPRWIRDRSGSLRPAAGSPTGHRCYSLDRQVQQDPSGVSLGREAIRQNYNVQFVHGGHAGGDAGEGPQRRLARQAVDDPVATEIADHRRAGLLALRANAAHLFLPTGVPALREGLDPDHLKPFRGRWEVFLATPSSPRRYWTACFTTRRLITIRGDSYRFAKSARSGLLQKAGAALQPNETANQ